MKFLRLTQPNQEPLAVRGDLIEVVRPYQFVPAGKTFIVGKDKVTVGSMISVGRNNYAVVEPVDEIVKQLGAGEVTGYQIAPDA